MLEKTSKYTRRKSQTLTYWKKCKQAMAPIIIKPTDRYLQSDVKIDKI